MPEKVYKTISKEEYERLKSMSWETAQGELFYRTTGFRRYWRPAMAWLYFAICAFDLLIMPVIWATLGGSGQYKSYTLESPVFHIAFGGIVGVSALGRSWEKMDQYRTDRYYNGGYNDHYTNDPYYNSGVPYPGSETIQMAPSDKLGDALSNNEDEIIPPSAGNR